MLLASDLQVQHPPVGELRKVTRGREASRVAGIEYGSDRPGEHNKRAEAGDRPQWSSAATGRTGGVVLAAR